MAEEQDIEQESFIQKWAPHLVAGVLVAAIAFYASQFQGGLSKEQGTWGQFGDFVGGAVNPIIGFFTIWLLAVSLRQNHKALSQANAELELTRKAIDDAKAMQAATEAALKAQTGIAEHAKDMNNAIVLMKHFDEVYVSAVHRQESLQQPDFLGEVHSFNEEEIERLKLSQEGARANREEMARIVKKEFARLVDKYNDAEASV